MAAIDPLPSASAPTNGVKPQPQGVIARAPSPTPSEASSTFSDLRSDLDDLRLASVPSESQGVASLSSLDTEMLQHRTREDTPSEAGSDVGSYVFASGQQTPSSLGSEFEQVDPSEPADDDGAEEDDDDDMEGMEWEDDSEWWGDSPPAGIGSSLPPDSATNGFSVEGTAQQMSHLELYDRLSAAALAQVQSQPNVERPTSPAPSVAPTESTDVTDTTELVDLVPSNATSGLTTPYCPGLKPRFHPDGTFAGYGDPQDEDDDGGPGAKTPQTYEDLPPDVKDSLAAFRHEWREEVGIIPKAEMPPAEWFLDETDARNIEYLLEHGFSIEELQAAQLRRYAELTKKKGDDKGKGPAAPTAPCGRERPGHFTALYDTQKVDSDAILGEPKKTDLSLDRAPFAASLYPQPSGAGVWMDADEEDNALEAIAAGTKAGSSAAKENEYWDAVIGKYFAGPPFAEATTELPTDEKMAIVDESPQGTTRIKLRGPPSKGTMLNPPAADSPHLWHSRTSPLTAAGFLLACPPSQMTRNDTLFVAAPGSRLPSSRPAPSYRESEAFKDHLKSSKSKIVHALGELDAVRKDAERAPVSSPMRWYDNHKSERAVEQILGTLEFLAKVSTCTSGAFQFFATKEEVDRKWGKLVTSLCSPDGELAVKSKVHMLSVTVLEGDVGSLLEDTPRRFKISAHLSDVFNKANIGHHRDLFADLGGIAIPASALIPDIYELLGVSTTRGFDIGGGVELPVFNDDSQT